MDKNIFKLKQVVSRRYVPLISDLFLSACSKIDLYQKVYFFDYYVSSAYCQGVFYYGKNAWDFGYALFSKAHKDLRYLDKVFPNIYKLGFETLRLSQRINKKNYLNKDWVYLKKDFDNFVYNYQVFSLSLLGYNLQHPVEDFFNNLLLGRFNFENDLAVLSSPVKENIYVKEQKSLLKLGLKIKRSKVYEDQSSELKNDIREYLKKYAWIYYRGGEGKVPKEKDIFKQILKMGPDFKQNLREISRNKKSLNNKSRALIKELRLNKKESRVVNIAKELVYFRTYRTDYLNWSFFNILPLLSEMGRRLNLSLSQVLYSRINELSEARPQKKNIINRRKNNYFIMTNNPNEIIFSDEPVEINNFKSKYLEEPEVASGDIRGRTAFSGIVKNRVCVINDKRDFRKMKENMILVTSMTTPDFIQVMKMASAIVTDEGGITCHAAIVSRELKKPCVIATKIATKALKDGDLVEVDADKGVVRIIK